MHRLAVIAMHHGIFFVSAIIQSVPIRFVGTVVIVIIVGEPVVPMGGCHKGILEWVDERQFVNRVLSWAVNGNLMDRGFDGEATASPSR